VVLATVGAAVSLLRPREEGAAARRAAPLAVEAAIREEIEAMP
jgi:hypothetical protein